MNGYFKPNLKNEKQELHCLELEDCDFISDDEVESYPIKGFKHKCPRCGSGMQSTVKDPYCFDCNWDSLSDFAYENEKCAA